MLSQYDSASGEGYVQLIQSVDEVYSGFGDFEISCDFLLLIKGKGQRAKAKIDQENQCYHGLGKENNASLQLFCHKSGFWKTCTGSIAQAPSARTRRTSSGKRKEH